MISMQIQEKINLIYKNILRRTNAYDYYLSLLSESLTKEELEQVKFRLLEDICTEFYFINTIPEDTLSLAYEDCLKTLEQNNSTKKH